MLKKILIADDSPAIIDQIEDLLSPEEYSLITAQDGIEALQKVYRENPDLIILDIIMPKMTGYQACRILKNDKDTVNIPVIFLTVKEQQKDQFWGYKSGADKYLVKSSEILNTLPFAIESLLEEFSSCPRPAELSHKDLDTTEIITLVNSLLDKELFDSTVINEVFNLSITIGDDDNLIKELLLLINRIVSFHTAFIVYLDDENDFWIRTNYTLPEKVIEEYRSRAVEELKKCIPCDKDIRLNTHVICGDDRYRINSCCSSLKEIESFHFSPLYLHNKCIGVFGLADKRPGHFDEEIIKTCDLILRQGMIIFENTKLYNRTRELAITDDLTKIYNHRYFQEHLAKELKRSERYGHQLSLIMLDIDDFKQINDRYGHIEGDTILREVARILNRSLRDVDTMARYGGEEFVIILPETPLEGAAIVAERLRRKIDEFDFAIDPADPDKKITVSLGVACYPENAQNQSQLIAASDSLLYLAKTKGKNQVRSPLNKNE